MLVIKDLHVSVEGNEIIRGLNLNVNAGETHAIMGPNGSGKSTLAYVLAGKEGYDIISGSITYKGKNLFDFSPEIRSREGIFLAFQYPVEIPGVNNSVFLKAALNARRVHMGLEELDAMDFLNFLKEKIKIFNIDENFLKRSLNEGFSGGEKKRNEMLQMAILEPSLSVLDETDSGLDIDALKIVAKGVNKLHSKDRACIVITHYQRLLDYIVPDHVHILAEGKIIRSGTKELALDIEKSGYHFIKNKIPPSSTHIQNI